MHTASAKMKCLHLLIFFVWPALCREVKVTIPNLGNIAGTTSYTAWTNRTFFQFMSVRFGQPPSGDRRYKPPEPVEKWNGVYDARSFIRSCPEVTKETMIKMQTTDEDLEDCLMLNLFTPIIYNKKESTELLPVMVYIHGGAFYLGSAIRYPPHYLLEKDIVLVILQYRLGPLGFISLQTDEIPGNAGFMDQLLGLQWVNKYVKYFGGDNTRVTVFGQSAGSAGTNFLLLSPMVDPKLVQQLIVQSGSAFCPWSIDFNPDFTARRLFRHLTKINDDVSIDVMASYFKNTTLFELFTACESVLSTEVVAAGTLGYAHVQTKGKVRYLIETPDESIRLGHYRPVPIITGVNAHDGSFILAGLYDYMEDAGLLNDNQYIRNNITRDVIRMQSVVDIGDLLRELLVNMYFKKLFQSKTSVSFVDIVPHLTDLLGVLYFKAGVMKLARTNSNYGLPTYLYSMDYEGENTRFGYGRDTEKYPFKGGSHHSDDLLYLFPYHYTKPLNDNDTQIAKLMVDFWTSFATNGKPTSSQPVPEWRPMEMGKNGPYYHINRTCYMDINFKKEYIVAITRSLAMEERGRVRKIINNLFCKR